MDVLQHYRAPPNERGSGKERGHGVELPICPACNEQLEPGKHHNKCKAGRTTNPPSKRAPKASNAGNRTTKSTRHAVTSKRLARDTNGVDAVCSQRNDIENSSKDVAPSNPSRCMQRTGIEDMEVAQGAFMVRPSPIPRLLRGLNDRCNLVQNRGRSVLCSILIENFACRCHSFFPAIRSKAGPRLSHKHRYATNKSI